MANDFLARVEACKKADKERLEAHIEALLEVEEQTRLAGEVAGTQEAACNILSACFRARAYETLNHQIVVLSKREGQAKEVVEAILDQAMEYVEQVEYFQNNIELIETINTVSATIGRAPSFVETLALFKEAKRLYGEAEKFVFDNAAEIFGWRKGNCLGSIKTDKSKIKFP